MAVLKYKNSNGEYVAIPTGIPSAVSAFDNDADYQNAEQVEVRIDEKMIRPAEWSGIWRDGSEFGINVADGLEITPDNHLRTESWLIPHDDGNVGDAIEDLRMRVEGVRFISLLGCENIGWIDNCVIGDCVPANDEQFVEEILNIPDGFEANIHINGDGFGRGFSVWLNRDGDTFIGGFDDGFEFERVELDAINHKLRLYCNPDVCPFIGQEVHNFELQFIEVSRPVKQIRTREGLWQNTMNGGERVEIGVNAGYGLHFEDGMVSVNENELFSNDNSAYPAQGEIGGMLDISPIQWGLDTEDWASDWVSHAVEDMPHLHLRLEVERDGEYFGYAGSCGTEPIQNGTTANGSVFDWVWDMTGALGDDVNAEVGIEKIEVGYSANDNQFFIVVSLGDTTKGYSLQYVRFGVRDKNPTLAHYCIGDWSKWETYEKDGMMYVNPISSGGVEQSYVDEMDRLPGRWITQYRCVKTGDTVNNATFDGQPSLLSMRASSKEEALKYLSLGFPIRNENASWGSSYYYDITPDDLASIGLSWGSQLYNGNKYALSGTQTLRYYDRIYFPSNGEVHMVTKGSYYYIPKYLNRFWYDNTVSGLKATDIPAAIDELKGMIDTLNAIGVAEEGEF